MVCAKMPNELSGNEVIILVRNLLRQIGRLMDTDQIGPEDVATLIEERVQFDDVRRVLRRLE